MLVQWRFMTTWSTHLICSKEGVEVIYKCQSPHAFIVQINAVVRVRQPDYISRAKLVSRHSEHSLDALMAVNGLALQEMETIDDCPIIRIAFGDIGMPSSKVRCEETEGGIMVFQSNANGPFVTRHASQACLSPFVNNRYPRH